MTVPVEGLPSRLLEQSFRQGLSHAYLFLGPKGAGKLETALWFVKKIFCTHEELSERPCGVCTSCRKVDSHNHPDLYSISADGQAVKIGQIRELQRAFSLKAVEASLKIYIIQDAEWMTIEAANAMLKFLEEPAFPCVAILIASSASKLLPTILSRCQVIPFMRQPENEMQQKLVEQGIKPEHSKLLARVLSESSQDFTLPESSVFAEVLQLVVQLTEDLLQTQRQPMGCVQDKIIKPGWSGDQVLFFLDCLALWYRDLLFLQSGLDSEIVYASHHSTLVRQSGSYSAPRLISCIEGITTTKKQLQAHGNLQLALEAMVIKMQGGGG